MFLFPVFRYQLIKTKIIHYINMSLSELLIDLQAAVDTAIKLDGNLKDKAFFNEIKEVAKIAKNGFTAAAGKALHRLDDSEPSEATVKQLVEGIPSALSYTNGIGRLPVQSAAWWDCCDGKYIPILAKEGIKHNVGGDLMRGGLLVVDPEDTQNMNTLQVLASLGDPDDPMPFDTAYLDLLKELRNADLLVKEDIKDHNLLFWSCRPRSKMRF